LCCKLFNVKTLLIYYYIDICEFTRFSELNKNNNFTVKLSFLFSLSSQLRPFDRFVWLHSFWSDTHYSISLCYTHNIVRLNSFYIKFESNFCSWLYPADKMMRVVSIFLNSENEMYRVIQFLFYLPIQKTPNPFMF
jgi:hypothetical protein